MVATGSRKSVNNAYRPRKEQFTVSITSVYNKLNGAETQVSRQMIRQTGMRMAEGRDSSTTQSAKGEVGRDAEVGAV